MRNWRLRGRMTILRKEGTNRGGAPTDKRISGPKEVKGPFLKEAGEENQHIRRNILEEVRRKRTNVRN